MKDFQIFVGFSVLNAETPPIRVCATEKNAALLAVAYAFKDFHFYSLADQDLPDSYTLPVSKQN